MDFVIWLWLAVVVAAVVCEAATAALVSIWFMPAALVSLVLAILHVPIWIQTVVFFILSIASIAVFQIFFKKYVLINKKTSTNVDMIIGEKAVVTERIDNITAVGCVKVKGQYWSARSTDDSVLLEVGEVVEVVSVMGVKLVCRRI